MSNCDLEIKITVATDEQLESIINVAINRNLNKFKRSILFASLFASGCVLIGAAAIMAVGYLMILN